jgi:hypothetical protein
LQTQGPISTFDGTTAAVIGDTSQTRAGLLNYTPLYLRVFADHELVSEKLLGDDHFSCSLILDDFSEQQGNEIAYSWVSIGNDYTFGVTVFYLR